MLVVAAVAVILVGQVVLVLVEMVFLTQLEPDQGPQIQVVVAVVQEITATVGRRRLAQAAPALLSSSTPYQAKPYLRSKERPLGRCQRV
jgi:hypothetical protein